MNSRLVVAMATPVGAADLVAVLGRGADGMTDPAASAHALLRQLLSDITGIDQAEHRLARRCATCGGPHGKPYLLGSELQVSLAYTPGLVAAAVCTGADVGVDVERISATGFAGFDQVALAPGETARSNRRRAEIWVRKEAYLKATGSGLAVDPSSVPVGRSSVVGPPTAQLYDVGVPSGFTGCVAVLGDRRPCLTLQRRRLLSGTAAMPARRATA